MATRSWKLLVSPGLRSFHFLQVLGWGPDISVLNQFWFLPETGPLDPLPLDPLILQMPVPPQHAEQTVVDPESILKGGALRDFQIGTEPLGVGFPPTEFWDQFLTPPNLQDQVKDDIIWHYPLSAEKHQHTATGAGVLEAMAAPAVNGSIFGPLMGAYLPDSLPPVDTNICDFQIQELIDAYAPVSDSGMLV